MKRKLALLLAAVMIIAALPMNVFAATTGNSIHPTTNAENKTLFFESGLYAGAKAGEVENNIDMKYWVDGSNLQIVFNGPVRQDAEINLTLENAQWYFRHNNNFTTIGGAKSPARNTTRTLTFNQEVDLANIEFQLADATATTVTRTQLLAEADWADSTVYPYVTGLTTESDILPGIDENPLSLGSALGMAVSNVIASTPYVNASGSVGVDGILDKATYDAMTVIAGTTDHLVYYNNDDVYRIDNSTPGTTTEGDDFSDAVKAAIISAWTKGELEVDTVVAGLVTFKNVGPYVLTLPVVYNFNVDTDVPAAGTVLTGNTSTSNPNLTFGNPTAAAASRWQFQGISFPTTSDTFTSNNILAGAPYVDATYNTTNGVMDFRTTSGSGTVSGAHYVYTRLSSGVVGGTIDGDSVDGTGLATGGTWRPYELTVMTNTNQRFAQVKLMGSAGTTFPAGDGIRVPLVILTNADGDYRIKVEQVLGSGVQTGTLLIGQKVTGRTKTTTESVTIRRNEIVIGRLKIAEVRSGSIISDNTWRFEIKAPRGYEFANDTLVRNHDTTTLGSNFAIYTDGGLKWAGGSTGSMPMTLTPNTTNSIRVEFKYENWSDAGTNRETDFTTLVFEVAAGTFDKSSLTLGYLYINGLSLLPEDNANIPFDKEIFLNIRTINSANNTREIITEEPVSIGVPKDYDITLKRVKDAIPELFSGRYEKGVILNTAAPGVYTDNIDNDEHQAAKVKFSEVVADAWWAQRDTVFTLPEEVRFLKVEFDVDTISKLTAPAVTRLTESTNLADRGDGIYYNSRKRFGGVTINDNTMTLTNLAVTANEKASFEFDIWLSIQVDFDGEVELTLDRKALQYCDRDDDIVCVIAKAITPIKITTTVTEAKVGYQYVAVADFYISENKAGALFQGYKAYISVTDEITIDMAIANTFVWDYVPGGNLKIKDVTTRSILGLGGGAGAGNSNDIHIEFTVQKESTVASELSFKNVEVKIDRYVPFSNTSYTEARGIDLHVWGPAVANNYYYLHHGPAHPIPVGLPYFNPNDLFAVGSIHTKYVNIATLATDSNQAGFVNHVVVTVDSKTYTVNGEAAELEVAPYISPESESTMVPVRFIANALGLSEYAVSWDPTTRTATVDANNRIIQFQVGSSYYTVNGTPVPMVSPAGLPVAMEITEDRAFVPFRALGDAFGIPVDWITETRSAVYNQPIMQ